MIKCYFKNWKIYINAKYENTIKWVEILLVISSLSISLPSLLFWKELSLLDILSKIAAIVTILSFVLWKFFIIFYESNETVALSSSLEKPSNETVAQKSPLRTPLKELSEREKEKLKLLDYEIKMFKCMYNYLMNNKGLSGALKNAVLESYLIHVRNLIEFFGGTSDNKKNNKKNESDIIMSDFKDKNGNNLPLIQDKDNDWKTILNYKEKINKFLCHLSEGRLNIDKNWGSEIETFQKVIDEQITNFIENISTEYFPSKDKENFGQFKEDFCYFVQKFEKETNNSEPQQESFTSTNSEC